MAEPQNFKDKVEHAKELIKWAIEEYKRTAVACSFGKDSMVVVHLARQVHPNIPVFSVMTQYKPRATFEYLRRMNEQMNLGTTVYMVADSVPEVLQADGPEVRLLATDKFNEAAARANEHGEPIYKVDPDQCCKLLKVDPSIEAVKYLDAWFTGLRNTEGRTRKDYQEVEPDRSGPGLVKVNPILTFTGIYGDIWLLMRFL